MIKVFKCNYCNELVEDDINSLKNHNKKCKYRENIKEVK